MGDIQCMYLCSKDSECGLWGLGKMLCYFIRSMDYMRSSNFKAADVGRVSSILQVIKEHSGQMPQYQWDSCLDPDTFGSIISLYDTFSDDALLTLENGRSRNPVQRSSNGRRMQAELKRLKVTIDKGQIIKRAEDCLSVVEKNYGMVAESWQR